jgi:hypothetical protein
MKKATRYELMAMKAGDFMGKTEVFARDAAQDRDCGT